ncbi:hypothetical protein DSOL_5322 [Desulfosporosinus metallidurans]|uniref:Uncharacterized protein n=1 Tax=Desulfosporosinus metallidurans TaxID=1888891 RepID=A0A1Q8QDP9_9FIRM|nr:hypothetical protein DSOL_5322 [Desulfosporosinus metallidurans]
MKVVAALGGIRSQLQISSLTFLSMVHQTGDDTVLPGHFL